MDPHESAKTLFFGQSVEKAGYARPVAKKNAYGAQATGAAVFFAR